MFDDALLHEHALDLVSSPSLSVYDSLLPPTAATTNVPALFRREREKGKEESKQSAPDSKTVTTAAPVEVTAAGRRRVTASLVH